MRGKRAQQEMVGFILIVKLVLAPLHPLLTGVTFIIPVIFKPVLFVGAIQFDILPIPLETRPIKVFVFVHIKVELRGFAIKLPILTVPPEQILILVTVLITGDDFILILKLI